MQEQIDLIRAGKAITQIIIDCKQVGMKGMVNLGAAVDH